MGTWRKRIAAVALAAGMVGAMAPAATATETTQVPCEAIFGDYICQQMADTGQFVRDTAGRVGPAVEEWRDRVAGLGKTVSDLVWCYVSGACPIADHIQIQP